MYKKGFFVVICVFAMSISTYAGIQPLQDNDFALIAGGGNCKCCAKNIGATCSGADQSLSICAFAAIDTYECLVPGAACGMGYGDGPSKHDGCPTGGATDNCTIVTTYCTRLVPHNCQNVYVVEWGYIGWYCQCKPAGGLINPTFAGSRDKCSTTSIDCD